ncbi:MAG: hypothetical protein IKN30_06850, partial [Synergistaceae bacterium]|nr:hypothetical protein [Synergistaceae bacterium]
MKQILAAVLSVILLSSASYGAASDDMSVYVRQDVFDAKMEALFSRLDAKIGELRNELKSEIGELRTELKSEIGGLKGDIKALSERVDGNFLALSNRVDGLEKRIEDTHTYAYWFIIIFLAMLALPFVNRWLERYEERKSAATVTIEDVKRLIAEARLGATPQA